MNGQSEKSIWTLKSFSPCVGDNVREKIAKSGLSYLPHLLWRRVRGKVVKMQGVSTPFHTIRQTFYGFRMYARIIWLGVITIEGQLRARHVPCPPQSILQRDLLPTNLPEAWSGETATAQDIANALSTKAGKPLPWLVVREAIENAIRSRFLETTVDSGTWPCDYANAIHVRLSLPREQPVHPTPGSSSPTVRESAPVIPGTLVAEADMQGYELQDLAEQIGNLTRETVGLNLRFHLRIELGPTEQISVETLAKVNEIMAEVSEKLKLERR
jgi:hypothetical protein